MGFGRVGFKSRGQGMPQPLRAGDGMVANFSVDNRAAETDETLTVGQVSGGLVQQGTTLTSDVVYTLPTAVALLASFTGMDIGDGYSFVVTNAQAAAFDVVIAVGTGITKVGANSTLAVPPQCSRVFTLVKSAAATFDLY